MPPRSARSAAFARTSATVTPEARNAPHRSNIPTTCPGQPRSTAAPHAHPPPQVRAVFQGPPAGFQAENTTTQRKHARRFVRGSTKAANTSTHRRPKPASSATASRLQRLSSLSSPTRACRQARARGRLTERFRAHGCPRHLHARMAEKCATAPECVRLSVRNSASPSHALRSSRDADAPNIPTARKAAA